MHETRLNGMTASTQTLYTLYCIQIAILSETHPGPFSLAFHIVIHDQRKSFIIRVIYRMNLKHYSE